MNSPMIYALLGITLFSIGLYGLIVREHLLRKILALNIMGSGIFLVLVALGKRSAGDLPDPVPHAMVITGIVVAVSATALALTLMLKLVEVSGSAVLHDAPKERS